MCNIFMYLGPTLQVEEGGHHESLVWGCALLEVISGKAAKPTNISAFVYN